MASKTQPPLAHSTLQVPILPSAQFRVIRGANEGDGLSFATELTLDDIYALTPDATQQDMQLSCRPDGHFERAGMGPSAPLVLDSILSFMSPTGPAADIMVLVALDAQGYVDEVLASPLTPLKPRTEYQLMRIDRKTARRRVAQHGAAFFHKGTLITLGSGAQAPVENLRAGDRLLTRDDGVQPLCWVSRDTLRATGPLAPVTIATGALNNSAPLTVSAAHRLFVYQRTDHIGAGQAEVLIAARDLVNGTTVTQATGGFADYVQLAFDRQQIVFAQGIGAETTRLDTRTQPILPQALHHVWTERPGGLGRVLDRHHLPAADAITKLQAAAFGARA